MKKDGNHYYNWCDSKYSLMEEEQKLKTCSCKLQWKNDEKSLELEKYSNEILTIVFFCLILCFLVSFFTFSQCWTQLLQKNWRQRQTSIRVDSSGKNAEQHTWEKQFKPQEFSAQGHIQQTAGFGVQREITCQMVIYDTTYQGKIIKHCQVLLYRGIAPQGVEVPSSSPSLCPTGEEI